MAVADVTTPEDDTSTSNNSSAASDEEPPQPISSGEDEEEDDDDDDDDDEAMNDDDGDDSTSSDRRGHKHYDYTKQSDRTTPIVKPNRSIATRSSRLLTPYRSVGVIIDNGSKFTLTPNQNSAQGFVTCGIGNRFHMLRTERLQPVLVSRSISPTAPVAAANDNGSAIFAIRQVVVDASTSTTLCVHGTANITLFHRTEPIQTLRLKRSKNNRSNNKGQGEERLIELVSMGHIRRLDDACTGRTLNHLVSVAILRIDREEDDEEDNDPTVPLVGEDDDSDMDPAGDDDSSSSSNEGATGKEEGQEEETMGDAATAKGVLVVLVSSRDNVKIQRRIYLPSVQPLATVHPATYLNKLLVGGQGGMCLVNIRSGKTLHDFTCLPPPTSSSSSPDDTTTKPTTNIITAMEQAPAVDTVAIGTSTGMVHLVNLKFDKLLFSLRHPTSSFAVTSLSFRTDASALHYGIAPLAVALKSGTIFVWDLNKNEDGRRTVLCEMKHAKAFQIQYYPQEPLMIVAGPNAIQMYIFDQPDHSPRLLRQRSGHTQPPTLIRYRKYGTRVMTSMDGTDASCCQIISASAGSDRSVRMFSTARSVLDREFSQGPGLEKKARHWNVDRSDLLLPPTTGLAVVDDIREWGNMVTIHEHHPFAYVWSTQRLAQSGPILRQPDWKVSTRQKPPPPSTHATALTLSACGNFALVGTRGGIVYKYNIQSGLPRGSFPKTEKNESDKPGKDARTIGNIERTGRELEKKLKTNGRASNLDKTIVDEADEVQKRKELKLRLKDASHQGHAVTGLCVNAVNRTLLSIGLDGKLILWSMESHAPHRKSPLKFACGITKLCHFRESDLAALAMQDCSILIFDCSALIVVRRMGKVHDQAITDLAFSPDGRTLYSSSLDGTMRAWDIPTNTCVDWIAFSSPPTSIAISPTGEFVGTTHVGKLGINLWSDRTYYQTLDAGARPPLTPCRIEEPDPMSEAPTKQDGDVIVFSRTLPTSETDKGATGSAVTAPDHESLLPKAEGLVTLSGLPLSHWKNLFHLELVKERNKPKEPPKKPPSAPFFLQWKKSSIVATDQAQPSTVLEDKDEWEAVWSDDEDEKTNGDGGSPAAKLSEPNIERPRNAKRRKVFHHRSHTATLLKQCSKIENLAGRQLRYQDITNYLAELGPSAIDVELSSLCSGMHDLEDGLPLLLLGAHWLQEACESRRSFEAVNAYMNRFLHLHGEVIIGIESGFGNDIDAEDDASKATVVEIRAKLSDSIARLKMVQKKAADQLRAKVEQSLCLVRHFSRIV